MIQQIFEEKFVPSEIKVFYRIGDITKKKVFFLAQKRLKVFLYIYLKIGDAG